MQTLKLCRFEKACKGNLIKFRKQKFRGASGHQSNKIELL